MMKKVAINGLGRIGWLVLRHYLSNRCQVPELLLGTDSLDDRSCGSFIGKILDKKHDEKVVFRIDIPFFSFLVRTHKVLA